MMNGTMRSLVYRVAARSLCSRGMIPRTQTVVASLDRSRFPVGNKSEALGTSADLSFNVRNFQTSALARKIVPFNLADIGEAIAEVEIVQWYKEAGDEIEAFENLCLVESDKASTAITSRYTGRIVKLHYSEGDMAATGSALCDIDIGDEEDGVDEIDEKASSESITPEISQKMTASSGATEGRASAGKFLTTPAVRRIAQENNIDLGLVTATGKNGRVLKEDVLLYLSGEQPLKTPTSVASSPPSPPTQPPAAVSTPPAAPVPVPVRHTIPLEDYKVVAIKGLQRTMVKTMNAAASIPVFGYADEIDVTKLVATRSALKENAASRGIRLSYLPFIMKAVSLALREYPVLNSHVNADATEMTYKSAHNISLAMQTPSGLLVPNVKNCESRSVFEIAAELNRLQSLGEAGLLTSADLNGGTFALSNIGSVGGTYMSPILVVPQTVIGALGGVRKLPRFDANGNVVAAHVMNVSWTADHRVIDGVTMATFSNTWKSYLENPTNMLLDLR